VRTQIPTVIQKGKSQAQADKPPKSRYEKAYRMRLSTTGGAGTYTDLLTCLRDAHDA